MTLLTTPILHYNPVPSLRSRLELYPGPHAELAFLQMPAPALLVSPKRAVENFHAIDAAFPGATVGYSVHANPHPMLLSALAAQPSSHFAVGAETEIATLTCLGVPGNRLFVSRPLRHTAHLEYAVDRGVTLFACDSAGDIEDLAQYTSPASPLEVYIRVGVPQAGLQNPHASTGAPLRAVELLHLARRRGLRPVGLGFSVGTECSQPEAWASALRTIAPAWHRARQEGLPLELLNIGGGLPAGYQKAVPGPGAVARAVHDAMPDCAPGCRRLYVEPGRRIAASAGALLLPVSGVSVRPTGWSWLHLDGTGLPRLDDIRRGIRPGVHPLPARPRMRNQVQYRLVCFTTESTDTLFDIQSPIRLETGDRVLLKSTGAYLFSWLAAEQGFTVLSTDAWDLDMDRLQSVC